MLDSGGHLPGQVAVGSKGPLVGQLGTLRGERFGESWDTDECVVTKRTQSFAKRCFKAFKWGEVKELEEGAL